uniref:Uncharacterized protein n=1 Tax=Capitella teleta TaxID=283909 RepID=X2A3G7_CAPTE
MLLPSRKRSGYEFSACEAEKKEKLRLKKQSSVDDGRRELSQLGVGDQVRVQPIDGSRQWREATVTRQLSGRSYETTDVNGRTLRRNRRMLRQSSSPKHSHRKLTFATPPQDICEEPAAPCTPPCPPALAPDDMESASETRTRSGRLVKKPMRFQ